MRAPNGAAAGAKPWDGNLQPVAGIYGANASGKTGLCYAMSTMHAHVRDSYRSSSVDVEPFAFDEESPNRPTRFTATFVADDGVCYAYGYSVLNNRVCEEWAERYTTARPTLLFTRTGMDFKFGTALKGPNRMVEKILSSSNLFLSAAMAAKHPGLKPMYEWFTRRLGVYPARLHDFFLPHVIMYLASDPEMQDRMATIVGRADTGVSGLFTETRHLPQAEKADDDAETYRAFGTHAIQGREYKLPLDLESDGTRAMLCHAFIMQSALKHGSTLVFDEIDASLHPVLVRELVKTFRDPQLNPTQAQLIFTTHDVSLIEAGYGNGALLSRDEMWITEKNQNGDSTLTPVADYSPRERDNLARRYMSGRFGGIPDIVDLVDPVLV